MEIKPCITDTDVTSQQQPYNMHIAYSIGYMPMAWVANRHNTVDIVSLLHDLYVSYFKVDFRLVAVECRSP